MDNASLILTTFDKHLHAPVRLIIYGRAALQLGFQGAPPDIAESRDVDAIIPLGEVNAYTDNPDFWEAQRLTNEELESKGLYITHLFTSEQVILRNNWLDQIVPLARPATTSLKLSRPATIDLVLTKMMRGADPQDIADIRFLIEHDRIKWQEFDRALQEAIIPPLAEIQDAFAQAKPIVSKLFSSGGL